MVLISADGLRPDAVTSQGPGVVPNIYRLIDGGVTTDNARSLVEETQTLPNHLSMVTSIGVSGAAGHGVTFNEDDGRTVHDVAGRYVPSVFDVVHDHGLSTSLFAGKPKFDFIDRSWDAAHGAPDLTGADDGTDKIDTYQRNDGAVITPAVVSQLTTQPAAFTMVHYAAPDAAGHEFGWSSPEYLAAAVEVDGYVGAILDAIEGDPDLSADTVVVFLSDHGGIGLFHNDQSLVDNYTIPFYVWGAGVPDAASLYSLNPDSRADPGSSQPDYSAPGQPIRNADAGNLIAGLLGLGPIPGSTIDRLQDLVVTSLPPGDSPLVSLTEPVAEAVVGGVVGISADATDADGIDSVEFFIDGAAVGEDSDGSDGWSISWDSVTAVDGSVTISVTATDTLGAQSSDSVLVTVDNVAPSVSISSPSDGATVSGSISITATATDVGGVAQVEFFADGSTIGTDSDGGDGWSVTWNTAAGGPGDIDLEAIATDISGKVASDAISVTVEQTGSGPVLMVTANPSALTAGEVAVRDRLAADGYVVSVVDDDATTASDASGAAFVIVMSSVDAGTVGDEFRSVSSPVWMAKPWLLDDMGMTGTSGGVDYGLVSSSTVEVVSAGHPMAAGRTGTVNVTASPRSVSFGAAGGDAEVVTTAVGVPTTFVYGAGTQLADGSTAAGCRITHSIFQSVPATFTSDGWALFDAVAAFAATDCGSVPGDTPPVVTLDSPVDGATVSGSVDLIATASDDDAVVEVEFVVDGSSVGVDVDGSDGWSLVWESTLVPDGSKAIEAVATDTVGQSAVDTVDVLVGNTPGSSLVLFVVGDASNPAVQDAAVRDRLEGLGHTVSVVDDSAVGAGDASGSAFVLVASSVSTSAVDAALFDIDEPLWIAKPWLFDDVGLTGPTANVDYGTTKATDVTIVDGSHPMAAGLSGSVTMVSSARSITWGLPGSAADLIGSVGNNATAFVYPEGSTLVTGVAAPGCRIAFPLFQTAVLAYTAEAWSMVDATVDYAANGCT